MAGGRPLVRSGITFSKKEIAIMRARFEPGGSNSYFGLDNLTFFFFSFFV